MAILNAAMIAPRPINTSRFNPTNSAAITRPSTDGVSFIPEGTRMFPKMVRASKGLWREVQDMARRGRDVWRLVPAAQKRSLFGAVLVMAGWAGANTAILLIVRTL